MRLVLSALMLAAGAAFMLPASAADDHAMVTPQDMKWRPGPGALPEGTEVTVLMGDPYRVGMYALRLKFPKGYAIPPHTHTNPEILTVMSGTLLVAMGEKADKSKAEALPAGSFLTLAPGMAHSIFTDEETVVQSINIGPWGITYVNPQDDPRQRKTQ